VEASWRRGGPGIISYPGVSRSLTVLPWRNEPMLLVCPPTHRLARRRHVAPADLTGENFVAFDPDLRSARPLTASSATTRSRDRGDGVRQHRDHQAGHRVGAGVSILPHPTVAKEAANHTLARSL